MPSPQQSLLSWYEVHGRHDLPWRNTDDPYRIYLSEIMLQQTQVKTVLERFYFPFLERFPTLADVAEADFDDVLKIWEGLGYYNPLKYIINPYFKGFKILNYHFFTTKMIISMFLPLFHPYPDILRIHQKIDHLSGAKFGD